MFQFHSHRRTGYTIEQYSEIISIHLKGREEEEEDK